MGISGNQKSLMYALGGIARGGAVRGGYVSGSVFISVGGDHIGNAKDDDAEGVLLQSLSISDSLYERENRCFFTCKGFAPEPGQPIRITLGSKTTNDPLFAGLVLETVEKFAMNIPLYPQWQVTATDHTWQLGFTRVSGRYQAQSVTGIARTLIALAAGNGFVQKVQSDLPSIDEFSVTNETLPDALTRLARRIGAYWYVDYQKVVHFFLEEVDIAPAPLTTNHASLRNPTYRIDDSQLITRCASEGGGSNALAEIRAGNSFAPTPTVTPVAGLGIESGAHGYAVTLVTGAGESLPSPVVSVTLGAGVANPTIAPTAQNSTPSGTPSNSVPIPVGITVRFAYAYSTGTPGTDAFGTKVTLASPNSADVVTISNGDPLNPGYAARLYTWVQQSPDPKVTEIGLYMWQSNDGIWGLSSVVPNTPYGLDGGQRQIDVIGTHIPAYPLPTANLTTLNRVNLSGIPIGASGVTARKLYRTKANLAQLQLLTTLADNSTTTYADLAADAALGANAPATDSSGLPQSESIIPVETAAWYSASGGLATSGPQRFSYTGKQDGGAGSLVGPGIGPAAAPTVAAVAGAGIEAGTHSYAVTFFTALGESLPSPLTAITLGAVANPPTSMSVLNAPNGGAGQGNNIPIGIQMYFTYSYSTAPMGAAWGTAETLVPGGAGPLTTISNSDPFNPTMSAALQLTIPLSTDPKVTELLIYAWSSTNSLWRAWSRGYAGYSPSGGNTVLNIRGASLPNPAGPTLPTVNSTSLGRVQLSNIPLGASTVTARRIYRSKANTTTPLQRVTGIADNTTTTYLDAVPDGSLTAETLPTSDSSGLPQPDGQAVAGASSILVAGTSAFSAGGGWAIIGNGAQVIRYTGVTASSLTGIPSSGVGAITATVSYNTTITAAPQLVGVSGVIYPILKGDAINVLVVLDHLAAQAALAAAIGGEGIIEAFIQDGRLSLVETRARAQATLDLMAAALVQVRYTSRDLRTRAGRTITIGTPMPLPAGTFRIQNVTISNFRPWPTQYPTFTVDASNRRYSFEDLLRRVDR